MIDSALALALTLLAIHLGSLALAFAKCSARPVRKGSREGVSLVRPVCGLESHIEATLESSFLQDRPAFEVIFCVAHEDDPAVPLVRALIARHPHVHASLLVGDRRISQNPKLNNMAKAWPVARNDIVIFADSNLLLPPDYCVRVVETFASVGAGVVSSPPVGDFAEGFWGEVECAMLNTHAARWQMAAAAAGLGFAQGKTLAFRRSSFGPDLMNELAREPAEDAAATKLARASGVPLAVLAPPFVHPVGARTAHAFWSRHLRWARLRRVTFPAVFALEAGCGAFPALAALLSSQVGSALPLALLPPLWLGVWYGVEYALARALDWRTNAWFVPACIVRDAMLPAFYVAAWMSGKFKWRGHDMDGAAKLPAT